MPLTLYHAGMEKCKPGHFYGPCVRTHYLIHYVLSGKGLFLANGQTYHLSSNSIFLIRPGESTYYEADSETPWEYCWIGFDGSNVQDILSKCNLSTFPIRSELNTQTRNTIFMLAEDYTNHFGNDLLYTGLLYQFFSSLLVQTEPLHATGTSEYVENAVKYIRQNYMYHISITMIAAHIGIDRSHLYRLFQQYMQISPQQYLLCCRIENAKHLLLETGYTITEIAYSCGFQDISTFDRAFYRFEKVSPSDYRKYNPYT